MKRFLTLLAVGAAWPPTAQTSPEEIAATPEKAGGVYYAYPVSTSQNTPPPAGYEPFYISHYGRHGSRYLIGDRDYKWVIDRMADARERGALTPLGLDVAARLESLWPEAEGRGGELTPLGRRQHHDIAARMAAAYPEAFGEEAQVTAASTVVMRCAHSMFAFIEGLKEQFPYLDIPRESSPRNMHYLNYHSEESAPYSSEHGPWRQEYQKFYEEKTRSERLMTSLFADSAYVRRWVNPADLMWGLYWIAVDMQNMETPGTFFDIFTTEELFNLWEVANFNFYSKDSAYPPAQGLFVDNAKNLLANILDTADSYIADGKSGATLRFGHDGNIIPLAALLQLPGALAYEEDPYELYKHYANFKVSPMGSNIQIVFFRNAEGDILVKFMLNEREVAIPYTPTVGDTPFYRWEDARATLKRFLDTPSRMFNPNAR